MDLREVGWEGVDWIHDLIRHTGLVYQDRLSTPPADKREA
jgi:hypothetical protein